jgi:hypothetical protein
VPFLDAFDLVVPFFQLPIVVRVRSRRHGRRGEGCTDGGHARAAGRDKPAEKPAR